MKYQVEQYAKEHGVHEDMTLKQFLGYLTDWNAHSERVLVEAIMLGDEELIMRACRVVMKHYEDGYLTDENMKERLDIMKTLEGEQ